MLVMPFKDCCHVSLVRDDYYYYRCYCWLLRRITCWHSTCSARGPYNVTYILLLLLREHLCGCHWDSPTANVVPGVRANRFKTVYRRRRRQTVGGQTEIIMDPTHVRVSRQPCLRNTTTMHAPFFYRLQHVCHKKFDFYLCLLPRTQTHFDRAILLALSVRRLHVFLNDFCFWTFTTSVHEHTVLHLF